MKHHKKDHLTSFFNSLENLSSEKLMTMVEAHLTDEEVEIFVDHLEAFYGIKDDEELGMLAQIMITGYLAAKFEENKSLNESKL